MKVTRKNTMPAQSSLLKSFLISTTLAWITQASTVTFKAVDIPPNNTGGISSLSVSSTISIFVSYSEAGVKSDSDGSETTYIREVVMSEQYLPDGRVITLPTPISAEGTVFKIIFRTYLTVFLATLVQSSGGFWISQVATGGEYEILTTGSTTSFSPLGTATVTDTQYQACSLESDGRYACVQDLPQLGRTQRTLSYTATASDAVFTNVGELKEDNHAVGSMMTMAWQAVVVLSAIVIGGMLVF
ncbi:hypothetical protein D9758_010851 [Tetrapyrgos nigripes]|uniref:Uncharacterized protein n=1 Tax=Tetrapyrgos nigripes TaxID=182062 RepID=A0A8H5GIK1_9AGAR|nr:hypothetical protein D9758_010851 [Tetrapyrgos nigripes]